MNVKKNSRHRVLLRFSLRLSFPGFVSVNAFLEPSPLFLRLFPRLLPRGFDGRLRRRRGFLLRSNHSFSRRGTRVRGDDYRFGNAKFFPSSSTCTNQTKSLPTDTALMPTPGSNVSGITSVMTWF